MRYRLVLTIVAMIPFTGIAMAQQGALSSADVAFWVSYWAGPPVILFGADQENFYKNMKNVMFLRNDYDSPVNPSALDDDVRWLKDHPSVRFCVWGFSSITGERTYNLMLTQKRADWVKQALVSRGIPESRILFAVGWGELYPDCAEDTQECRDRNKLVRLIYFPG